MTTRVTSNFRASFMAVLGSGVFAFIGYWMTDMEREISQLWENREHVNRIFDWFVKNAIFAGPLAAWYNDKTSPRDEIRPEVVEIPAPPPRQFDKPPIAATPKRPVDPPVLFDDVDLDLVDFPDEPVDPPEPVAKKNYFGRHELECSGTDCDCEFPGMDRRIMDIMNDFREQTGPVFVNSAFRCPDWNRLKGGEDESKHLLGMAMDIRSKSMTPDQVYSWFEARYPDTLGLGRYNRFTHVDSRQERARWDNRTNYARFQ